jgi:hypothetical protein
MNYSLLNSSNICTNNIIWNGQSEWQPPEDHTLVSIEDFTEYPIIGNEYSFDTISSKWINVTPEIQPTEEDLLLRCNYFAFWDSLITSQVYQSIRQQALQDLNVNFCCTEFIAAITDAKYGRVNKDAIQSCINRLINSLTLTQGQIEEINSLFEIGRMTGVYTIPQ